MTRDELASLLDAYRDGEITSDDAVRIAAVIRHRGAEAEWVLSEIESAGMIAQALDTTDSEAFARGFFERLRAEGTGDCFVHDFEDRRTVVPFPIPSYSRRWWIAAAAVLLLGASLWGLLPGGRQAPRLEHVQGSVVVLHAGRETTAHAGQRLSSGSGLRVVGEESSASIAFPDGTRLDIGADSIVAEVSSASTGKRVVLSEGFLTAQVARQPAGQPMILATPHSEVVVLGTAFSLSSGSAATVLETQAGNVRINRKSDGRSVEVPAGFDAVVTATGEPLTAQPLTSRITKPRLQLDGCWTTALAPDGKTFAATSYLKGDVELWDVATGQRQLAFRAHPKRVFAVAFSPDGQTLATGSLDGTVKLWDRASGALRSTLTPGLGGVVDVAFSSAETLTVLSLDEAGGGVTLSSWAVSMKAQRWVVRGFHADHRAFSPGGKFLAATSRQHRNVTIWDLETGKVSSVLGGLAKEFPDVLRNVFSMAFSHDGRTLALDSSTGLVTLWDVTAGQIRTAFQRHGGRVYGMTFSPGDRMLATGHQDGTVRLWNLETTKPLGTFVGHSPAQARAVAFTPDGSGLLSREIRLAAHDTRRDGAIQLWSVPGAAP